MQTRIHNTGLSLSSLGIKLLVSVYLARGCLLLSVETNEAKIQGLRLGCLEEHRSFISHHLRSQNRLHAEKKSKENVNY
jgi:hypothetical protein